MDPNSNKTALAQKYEKLFSIYFSVVRSYAWLLLKSEEDAEDIAQDIFTKLWLQPSLWEQLDDEALHKRLYVITKNTTLNFIRHRKLESDYQEEVFQESLLKDMFNSEDPMDAIYIREIRLIVKLTLDRLPPKRRRIFIMSRLEGKSNQDIADRLGISVRTVEHQIYRTLAELKKTIFFAFFLLFV